MADQKTIDKLKKDIAQLRELGVNDKADEKQIELDKLTGGNMANTVNIPGMDNDVSQEEYAKSSSKFPAKGLHPVEFQGVDADTPGQSLKFTFIITAGPNEGTEGKISTSVKTEKGLWKWKEIWKSLGIADIKNSKGNIDVGAMMAAVAGKKGMVFYGAQTDTRPESEGGKGTKYTKAESVYPVGTKTEDVS